MRKKFISILCLVFSMFMLTLVGCSSTDKLKDVPEMLGDNTFKNGFNLTTQTTVDNSTKTLDYMQSTTLDPMWRLAQWGILKDGRVGYDKTQHDLMLGTEEKNGDVYTYATKSNSKVVNVNPKTGEIDLMIDSQKEYGNIPRMENEDWPHILIEQPIADLIFLDQMKSCWIDIEFELLKNEKSQYNNSTAQFQWIFTIQNLNSSAPSGVYKDYMWFNITLFDDRYDYAPGAGQVDSGKEDATAKFIYGPKGKDFMPSKVEVGNKIRVQKDFLPEMKNAFAAAQKAGSLKGSTLSDMGLGSLNIGWEVPGIYDIGVKITKLSLKAEINE